MTYGDPGVEIFSQGNALVDQVLTSDALRFLIRLQRTFSARRTGLLAERVKRQLRLDAGEKPDFLAETRAIRKVNGPFLPSRPILRIVVSRSQVQPTAR